MIQPKYLIIDWGTSNFRAFLMNGKDCIDKIEKPLGLLAVQDKQFELTLAQILQEWLSNYQHLPIYMAGMVGSANGWLDCGYIETPVSLKQLALNKQPLSLSWGAEAYIIPGVSHFSQQTQCHDVMRGEEVQVFGLIHSHKLVDDAYIILPGTHSKHVVVAGGQLIHYSSYMTGEFYSLLTQHSILTKDLPEQITCDDSFKQGVALGFSESSLLHKAFMARTQKLFQAIPAEHITDYLSGILIGEELSNIKGQSVYIVGNSSLSKRYKLACQSLAIESEIVNGDSCFLNGMKEIKRGDFL